jgi:hypothetical protein
MTDLTMQTLTDLTSLTVAGGKIGNIKLDSSPNIAVANFDHTSNMENKGSTTANKSVSFIVTDNTALTKLHTTGDLIHTFTVTGNDALAELDMTGVKTRGTETTGGTVNLYDNGLTAVKSTDNTDAETATATTGADGGSADVGATDDGTSGMDTMKIYLTAIAADTKNTAQVNFDTVSTFDDSETSTTATTLNILGSTSVSATTNDATVLKMTPATANTAAASKGAIAQTIGYYVDTAAVGGTIRFTINGALIPAGGVYTLTGNQGYDAAQIASTANVAAADAAGAILASKVGAFSTSTVLLIAHANNATTAVGERYGTTAALTAASTDTAGVGDTSPLWSVGLEDLFTLTVGSNTVTTSLTSGATTIGAIETKLAAVWAAKYGSAGTHSASAIASLTGTLTNGTIEIAMLQSDSAGFDQAVSFGISDGSTSATANTSSRTAANIGWKIGATKATGDNKTISSAADGLIITLTSKAAGTDLNTLATVVTATSGVKATLVNFATNYVANTAWAAGIGANAYVGAQAERTDVATAEDAVAAATSNAVAAIKFNRVTWLG